MRSLKRVRRWRRESSEGTSHFPNQGRAVLPFSRRSTDSRFGVLPILRRSRRAGFLHGIVCRNYSLLSPTKAHRGAFGLDESIAKNNPSTTKAITADAIHIPPSPRMRDYGAIPGPLFLCVKQTAARQRPVPGREESMERNKPNTSSAAMSAGTQISMA